MQEIKLAPMPKNLMFALDIGTRSVIGVLSKKVNDTYEVLDYALEPHPERAMFDGQIHDIAKVTQVVKRVIETLETRNGFKLEQASIAAAGRALKTARAEVEGSIDVTKEIDKNLVDGFEMQAIQEAQDRLLKEDAVDTDYYCVGHSVIGYALDGAMILNPIGHRGRRIKIGIIATFLPHIVVDSLYAVVHKAGLEVMNLTLEPIAAINVAIPPHLRMLNLALVDVGAGTSDIAISKEGAVMSYGMVAKAGDKLTEHLAQTYLLDFNTAETLKIGLSQHEQLTYTDVIGMTHTVDRETVMNELGSGLKELTQHIADTLLELNQKSPSAVFCIGGGSQIPQFTQHLAEALGLPEERVVIKSAESLEKVVYNEVALNGPEFITPVGIGVTAFEERDQDFIQVTVNETTVRLFHSKPLHVSDALVLTGYSARKLIAERGENISYTLNGRPAVVRGDYGEPARILVNGAAAALHTRIGHKDHIVVVPAEAGKKREAALKTLIDYDGVCYFGETPIRLVEYVSVNGTHRTADYIVKAGDVVETEGVRTIADLARLAEVDLTHFDICLDGEPLDALEMVQKEGVYTVKKCEREVEEEVVEAAPVSSTPYFDYENKAPGIDVLVNGETVEIPYKDGRVVFVDIFDHIEFDLSEPKGILHLRLNGERAKYTDLVEGGDVIEIKWNQ